MTVLKNTLFVFAVALVLVSHVAGCATSGGPTLAPEQAAVTFDDPPVRPNLPTLVIAMPPSSNFAVVRKSLISEIQKNFNIRTLPILSSTTVADLEAVIASTHPVAIVLMNNATISLYRQYLKAHPQAPVVPAILLMASFIEEARTFLPQSTGIAYEVPGVTAFVHLRSLVTAPVTRVGVVFRPGFRHFVEKQKALAAKENIQVVSLSVADDADVEEVREAVSRLIGVDKVSALWLLNDNSLVPDADFIEEAWRAELADAKVPLIVGVANLVEPQSSFGALAVVPDHEALGLQAANLIFDLADNDWNVADHPVELPLSVKTIIDVKLLRETLGLRPDALKHVDRALE